MHVTASEVIGLHALLAVVLTSVQLTTTHARLVSQRPSSVDNEDYPSEGSDDEDDGIMWPVVVLCPPNNFFSVEKDDCMNCSSCPIDHYIQKACHDLEDTVCRPFWLPPPDSPADSISNGQIHHRHHNASDNSDNNVAQHNNDGLQWTFPSFVVIGVTAVLCVVTCGIALLCFFRIRSRIIEKEIICRYNPAPEHPVEVV